MDVFSSYCNVSFVPSTCIFLLVSIIHNMDNNNGILKYHAFHMR